MVVLKRSIFFLRDIFSLFVYANSLIAVSIFMEVYLVHRITPELKINWQKTR